jgi:hypothetical protein
MTLRRRKRLMKRPNAIDRALDAYMAWREECAAVRAAYLAWTRAGAAEAALAFDAYWAVLDREERAAALYADLARRVGHMPEFGLARQLSHLAAAPGAKS